jgi:hypothetical protein
MLYDTSREVQTTGYQFNSEINYPLVRNIDYELAYPINTLSIDASEKYSSYDVVMRGGKLYDRKNHTFVFSQDITVDCIFFLEWTQLPQPARQYITILAARRFQRRFQGDAVIDAATAQEEIMARAQLEDFDAYTRDYNLADSYDIFNIIRR